MRKVTEIPFTRHKITFEKDENGKKVEVKTPYEGYRIVETSPNDQRIVHFFIDGIVYGLLFYPIDSFFGSIDLNPSSIAYAFFIAVFPLTFGYSIYYFLFEYFTQTTPGKYLTKTIVIDEYGNKPSISSLIIRSLIRVFPFEPFSCFGIRGWHDKWSKTWVVSRIENQNLQELIKQ